MREKPATGVVPSPAVFINAQSAIAGLRGRDLLSTLRSVAAHGLRNPIHSAKHALKLGGQLGRVLLGETLHPTNPQDSRFADNTVLNEIGARFYAGMPLHDGRGLALGTLCVIDRQPRHLDSHQRDQLQHLAQLTGELFELRLQARRQAEQSAMHQAMGCASRTTSRSGSAMPRRFGNRSANRMKREVMTRNEARKPAFCAADSDSHRPNSSKPGRDSSTATATTISGIPIKWLRILR